MSILKKLNLSDQNIKLIETYMQLSNDIDFIPNYISEDQQIENFVFENERIFEIAKKFDKIYYGFESGKIYNIDLTHQIENINKNIESLLLYEHSFNRFLNLHSSFLETELTLERFANHVAEYVSFKYKLILFDDTGFRSSFWLSPLIPNVLGYFTELAEMFFENKENIIPIEYLDFIILENYFEFSNLDDFQDVFINKRSFLYHNFLLNKNYESVYEISRAIKIYLFGEGWEIENIKKLKELGFEF